MDMWRSKLYLDSTTAHKLSGQFLTTDNSALSCNRIQLSLSLNKKKEKKAAAYDIP